jgi:hypothetical protein
MTLQEQTIMRAANPAFPKPVLTLSGRTVRIRQFRNLEK